MGDERDRQIQDVLDGRAQGLDPEIDDEPDQLVPRDEGDGQAERPQGPDIPHLLPPVDVQRTFRLVAVLGVDPDPGHGALGAGLDEPIRLIAGRDAVDLAGQVGAG